MRRNQLLYLGVTAFALVLCASSAALGCSCAPDRPTCEAFGSSQAVFVGKVVGAKEHRQHKNEDGTTSIYEVGEIYFKVEQSFFGTRGSRAVIHSGTGGGDCGYWFVKGERYLVYAYGESKDELWTSICSRTKPLENAEEDLGFLRTMPRKGSGVRVYGTVAATLRDPKSPDRRTPKPLAGIVVKVVGKQTVDGVTDVKGEYELTGLPPGRYKIYAEVPEYYYRGEYWEREVEVADRGCVGEDFFARNDSLIAGRVLQVDGTVLPKVTVELVPAEAEAGSTRRLAVDTGYADDEGEFELKQIPPGRYLLGVNLTSSAENESPFPATFYPGTTDQSKATVIEIGLGEKLSGIDIHLPPSLAEYVVRGFVTWADGSLAAGVDVYLEDINSPDRCISTCGQKTDAQGQFELRGYSGYTYRVVSTADRKISKEKTEGVYGDSSPFALTGDSDGMKIILAKPGRPWDNRDKESEESKPSK